MAIEPVQLLSADVTANDQRRIYPTASKPCRISEVAVTTYLPGTLMAFNISTHKWVKWVNSGTNGTGEADGILWPDAVTTHATNERIANIMFAGRAQYQDLHTGDGSTQGTGFDVTCEDNLRTKGINIEGLPNVNA